MIAAQEFGGMLPKLDRDVRREFVGQLAESGMSSRAIAPVVGVADRQVRRDIAAGTSVPPATNLAPVTNVTTADGEIVDAEIVEDEPEPEPRRITGRDGKTYPAPSAQPRRKALPDVARPGG